MPIRSATRAATPALSGATLATAFATFVMTACGPARAPSPTPPPGLAVKPRAQVVDVHDAASRARWKAIQPGVHGVVLASSDLAIVDLVEYAVSTPTADPYKDNIRYVIAGTGTCTVDRTRVAVRAGDLVVVPRGSQRSCAAASGTLAFLTVSVSRGESVSGGPAQAPPAGRIKFEEAMAMLRSSTAQFSYAPVYQNDCCWILAAQIAQLEGHPSNADQFVYDARGSGTLTIDGRPFDLRPGSIGVIPTGATFVLHAAPHPIDALLIRVEHASPKP